MGKGVLRSRPRMGSMGNRRAEAAPASGAPDAKQVDRSRRLRVRSRSIDRLALPIRAGLGAAMGRMLRECGTGLQAWGACSDQGRAHASVDRSMPAKAYRQKERRERHRQPDAPSSRSATDTLTGRPCHEPSHGPMLPSKPGPVNPAERQTLARPGVFPLSVAGRSWRWEYHQTGHRHLRD